jgi:hypothetical protein
MQCAAAQAFPPPPATASGKLDVTMSRLAASAALHATLDSLERRQAPVAQTGCGRLCLEVAHLLPPQEVRLCHAESHPTCTHAHCVHTWQPYMQVDNELQDYAVLPAVPGCCATSI